MGQLILMLSLAKLLSTTPSTACFDKNPQSQARGITLDLGFSSFQIGNDPIQTLITLVDCPGHASLFRTVIGAGQVLDAVILVVDVVHGIQTQTAECLVLLEALRMDRILVLLNKIDQIKEPEQLSLAIARIRKTIQRNIAIPLENFTFLPVSANDAACRDAIIEALEGMGLVNQPRVSMQEDLSSPSFLMAIDHCFAIKGQGTILTGIILRGRLSVNDEIEVAAEASSARPVKRVKSIQVFHNPVQVALPVGILNSSHRNH